MTNYIFDLYGTLIDIHTSESKASLWKEVALLFSMNGVPYAETELRKSYLPCIQCQIFFQPMEYPL